MSSRILYLDNNATTAIDPEVRDAMWPYLGEFYGNPSSAYSFGRRVHDAIEASRAQVAALINAAPEDIIFTSCGTESNNTAILSALERDRDRQQIVTTKVEHSAIVKHAEKLARKGYEIRWIKVDDQGRIDPDEVRKAVSDETAILSIMKANNETGVLFPVEELAAIAEKEGALFHTDAVQAVGKLPIDVKAAPIHLLSLSGHKLHCPKGIAALYVHPRIKFQGMLIGGGQEEGRRGGTENVASIIALGKAAELANQHLQQASHRMAAMRDRFESIITERLTGVKINGGEAERLPNTTNMIFDGIDGEGLLILLDQEGVCASAGSACTTGSLTPSHVLTAMGLTTEQARSSLRFSFSRLNRDEEAEEAAGIVVRAVEKMRALGDDSPVLSHTAATH